MPDAIRCSVCEKRVQYWMRREGKIYCVDCFKDALKDRAGLSTHSTEEANLRTPLSELASQEE
ncbi:MAG: hypothetical protein ACE5KI_02335 [Dehalococcoidia bacterium]